VVSVRQTKSYKPTRVVPTQRRRSKGRGRAETGSAGHQRVTEADARYEVVAREQSARALSDDWAAGAARCLRKVGLCKHRNARWVHSGARPPKAGVPPTTLIEPSDLGSRA
jgi:hypothetical protein